MTDQSTAADERSIARLLALTDAVFAIAMTLLAIDLKVPDVEGTMTAAGLTHALLAEWPSYLAFALSFYLIAGYWRRHHREMRDVTTCTSAMVHRTILLLFAISSMPFAAALLGQHGGTGGIAVAIYAVVNAVAIVAQLAIGSEARRLTPSDARQESSAIDLVFDLIAYLFAAPAAYLFDNHGVVILIVALVIAGWVARAIRFRGRHSST